MRAHFFVNTLCRAAYTIDYFHVMLSDYPGGHGTMEFHIHCSECLLANCDSVLGCALSRCDRQCGAVLHQCKLDEHRLICSNASQPCPNASYGCPFVLPRSKFMSHLRHCPASVLPCKRVWSRLRVNARERHGIIDPMWHATGDEKKRSFRRENPRAVDGQLDAELTYCDEVHLLEPVGRSKKRTPSVEPSFDANCKWDDLVSPALPSEIGEESGNDVAPLPPPPPFDLVREEDVIRKTGCGDRVRLEDRSWTLDFDMISVSTFFNTRSRLDLFCCDRLFRRDEIGNHYDDVHGFVQSNLGAWTEMRCPYKGCSYARRNLVPAPRGCRVRFARERMAFSIIWPSSSSSSSSECEDFDRLSRLPDEILLHIGSFLDGFALCNLALTCRRLREICSRLLNRRGMVEIIWERVGENRWVEKSKVWSFSTSFSSVSRWLLSNEPSMVHHMMSCPHKDVGDEKGNSKRPLVGLSQRSIQTDVKAQSVATTLTPSVSPSRDTWIPL